jgi:aquaporin related protein
MTKTITHMRGFLLVGAQVEGAIFASFSVSVLFPLDFNVRTTLSESTSVVRGPFIEAILTAEIVFTVFMLAKEKHKATYMAPVGIGLTLFVAELVVVFFTGRQLEPGKEFATFCDYWPFLIQDHWVYWVGPATGVVAAYVFYRFSKI